MPGLAMYILIGRTQNYAWSLTSADHDVRDVFAELLCNKNGTKPTRASTHYLYKGRCRALKDFNAGMLRHGAQVQVSVHGPIIGTATVGGRPYALARKRSTFGRDALNLGALHDLTDGKASTPREVLRRGQPVRIHVQLGLRLAQGHVELLVGPAAEARPRARPAPAHPGQRQVRVARLPPGRSTRTTSAVRAGSC